MDIPGRRFKRATPVQQVDPADLHLVSELGTSDLNQSGLSMSPSRLSAPRMDVDSARTSPTTVLPDATTGETISDSPLVRRAPDVSTYASMLALTAMHYQVSNSRWICCRLEARAPLAFDHSPTCSSNNTSSNYSRYRECQMHRMPAARIKT